jgi:YD repeat-containing protein
LIQVSKPDGRSEVFAYKEAGKLTSITEVGVGVTDCTVTPEGCRTWRYSWVWHLLTRIDMPDGRAWRLD